MMFTEYERGPLSLRDEHEQTHYLLDMASRQASLIFFLSFLAGLLVAALLSALLPDTLGSLADALALATVVMIPLVTQLGYLRWLGRLRTQLHQLEQAIRTAAQSGAIP